MGCTQSSNPGYYRHGAADQWRRTFEKLDLHPSEIDAMCALATNEAVAAAVAVASSPFSSSPLPRALLPPPSPPPSPPNLSLSLDRKFMKIDEDKSHTISIWEVRDWLNGVNTAQHNGALRTR